MLGDATDEASQAIRAEAEEKLKTFLGWIDGSLPRPSDEERQKLVREVTALYRRARAASGNPPPISKRPAEELSDESTERLTEHGKAFEAATRGGKRSASGEQ